ncbi:aspartyl protease family protein At5g10770-like [Elaeis guineensis]|uniref:aspartyl protease family protein At5g10770-like n=1 Tax=Elaeis guineensis var. tenera TaxID=51953 RepID=UPI003C6D9616
MVDYTKLGRKCPTSPCTPAWATQPVDRDTLCGLGRACTSAGPAAHTSTSTPLLGLAHSVANLRRPWAPLTESRAIFLDTSSNGYLTIAAGVQNSLDVKFTRMITESYLPSFYSLELIGMSVGGKDLAIPSTAFTDVGTIFDSGTTITWLPPAAYSALSSEFRQHMSKHSLVTPLGKLDTCYNFTGYNRIRVPAIALQFSGGVMLNVDASGILLFASPLQGCLAFASNDKDEFSIVGNMQQRTFDVVYAIMSRVESMDDEVGEYIEGSSGVRM